MNRGQKLRIGYAGFQHESNSFAHVPASLEKWLEAGVLTGDAIRNEYKSSQATIAGYYERFNNEKDIELVPLVFARLTPSGQMSVEATEYLFHEILNSISANGPWDAILLPLHGAAVSDLYSDADGELVKQVRELVGPDVIIGTSLDMHANISQKLVDHSNIVTSYQTNPHIDAHKQAFLAADLVLRTVRGEVKPSMHLSTPPLTVNILSQGTSDEPMATILRGAAEARSIPGVLYVGVIEGYPYSDVTEMGMTFIAITNDNPNLAEAIAEDIAMRAWELREELQGGAVAIDDALKIAAEATSFPVVLFDVGDNIGAGTPGDSTFILHAARKLGITGVTQALCDREVVLLCQELGIGARVSADVGGKADSMHGEPLSIDGKILAIVDGRYEEAKASHGGFRFYDDGPSALIKTDDGFTLLVTTFPAMSSSLEQFRAVGVDPVNEKIMVVKGVHSPRPAYEPIAAKMIWLATPGASSADLSTFAYKHRRTPMYPFELDTKWNKND
jgi:microcystin degradation protein MlrC